MSLINKMLQDLEARDPETVAEDLPHRAIRPVPARSRIHPAWPVAGVSTVAFAFAIGGFVWHKTRSRTAEIPVIVQQAQLPLKMADRLMAIPQTDANVAQVPVQETTDVRQDAALVDEKSHQQENSESRRVESAQAEAVASKPSLSPKLSSRLDRESVAVPRSLASAKTEPAQMTEPHAAPAVEKIGAGIAALPIQAASDSASIAAAKQVHELTPHEKAENEYRKASLLIPQGRSAEAIPVLEQSLSFDPRHGGARQLLIGLLLNAKRTDDAMSRAKEGLALDSSQTSLAIILARLQVDKGDLQDAIDTLQRSMSAGAANAEYQAFYAALMQRSANHKEAVEHYAAALRLSPQNGVWWMGMGISLQAEGRTDEAKDAYLRAKSSGALSPALATFVDQRLNQLAH